MRELDLVRFLYSDKIYHQMNIGMEYCIRDLLSSLKTKVMVFFVNREENGIFVVGILIPKIGLHVWSWKKEYVSNLV